MPTCLWHLFMRHLRMQYNISCVQIFKGVLHEEPLLSKILQNCLGNPRWTIFECFRSFWSRKPWIPVHLPSSSLHLLASHGFFATPQPLFLLPYSHIAFSPSFFFVFTLPYLCHQCLQLQPRLNIPSTYRHNNLPWLFPSTLNPHNLETIFSATLTLKMK